MKPATIILLRGGSKRSLGDNIRNFSGNRMTVWSSKPCPKLSGTTFGLCMLAVPLYSKKTELGVDRVAHALGGALKP